MSRTAKCSEEHKAEERDGGKTQVQTPRRLYSWRRKKQAQHEQDTSGMSEEEYKLWTARVSRRGSLTDT